MRVIAGSARGRTLRAVRGTSVRPTADRVREALFSILVSRVPVAGTVLLDLFAGTGALGIEALSRGAERVTFVERTREASLVLRSNLLQCDFVPRGDVLTMPVARALQSLRRNERRFDGALLDPPYGKGLVDETLRSLADLDLLGTPAWVMAEAHVDDQVNERYGAMRLTITRRYGKTVLALFMNEPATGGAAQT